MYYGPMMDDGGWGLGILMMVFWFIVFVIGTIIAVRLLKSYHETNSSGPNPLDRAKMRYAQGEITKEQFEQLKKDLSK